MHEIPSRYKFCQISADLHWREYRKIIVMTLFCLITGSFQCKYLFVIGFWKSKIKLTSFNNVPLSNGIGCLGYQLHGLLLIATRSCRLKFDKSINQTTLTLPYIIDWNNEINNGVSIILCERKATLELCISYFSISTLCPPDNMCAITNTNSNINSDMNFPY
jgi:hypothetical protein